MAQPGAAAAAASDSADALLQRVAELEKINAEFLRTKQQLEQEFNQKRAKFKELYLAKEGYLHNSSLARQAKIRKELAQDQPANFNGRVESEGFLCIAMLPLPLFAYEPAVLKYVLEYLQIRKNT